MCKEAYSILIRYICKIVAKTEYNIPAGFVFVLVLTSIDFTTSAIKIEDDIGCLSHFHEELGFAILPLPLTYQISSIDRNQFLQAIYFSPTRTKS